MDKLQSVTDILKSTLPEIECALSPTEFVFRFGQKEINLVPVPVISGISGGRLWLKSMIEEHRHTSNKLILFAAYFNPEICRELRANRINFLSGRMRKHLY